MAKMRFVLVSLLLITAMGCKKDDPTSWETEVAVPIAFGRLDMDDLFADSLLIENSDGTLSLRYEQKVLELSIDSILEIPGDTVVNVWSLPVSLQVPPNTLIFSQDDEFEFANSSASLSSATLRSGELMILITNEIASEIVLEYSIPEAINEGMAFSITVNVPPAVDGVPGTTEAIFDIADYALDLTGEDGNTYNSLKTTTRIRTPSGAETTQIPANKEITLEATYNSLSVSSAVGYFNTTQSDFQGTESTFDEFAGLYEAILSLESATAILNLKNGFGADLRAIIGDLTISNSFSGVAIDLENSNIQAPINLTRAIKVGNTLVPTEQSIVLNPQNSNIVSFIETLGDSLGYSGVAVLNPLGNISNFNDFIVEESSLDIEIDIDIPLNFSITNLVLRDTVDIEFDNEGAFPVEMELYLMFDNSFPLSLEITPIILDSGGNEVLFLNDFLLNESPVISGGLDPTTGPATTVLKYELDAQAMSIIRTSGEMMIQASTESNSFPDHVVIRAEQGIDVRISSVAKLLVE